MGACVRACEDRVGGRRQRPACWRAHHAARELPGQWLSLHCSGAHPGGALKGHPLLGVLPEHKWLRNQSGGRPSP